VQECRLLTPQDAGMIVIPKEKDGIPTHLPVVSRPNKKTTCELITLGYSGRNNKIGEGYLKKKK
jgi:hypothetical protein